MRVHHGERGRQRVGHRNERARGDRRIELVLGQVLFGHSRSVGSRSCQFWSNNYHFVSVDSGHVSVDFSLVARGVQALSWIRIRVALMTRRFFFREFVALAAVSATVVDVVGSWIVVVAAS